MITHSRRVLPLESWCLRFRDVRDTVMSYVPNFILVIHKFDLTKALINLKNPYKSGSVNKIIARQSKDYLRRKSLCPSKLK